jgi:hypothetical protein
MATPAPTMATGDSVQSLTVNADEIKLDPNEEADEGTTLEKQLDEFTKDDQTPPEEPAPTAAPAATSPPKPADETVKLPDALPKVEPDEPELAEKAAPAEKPAVEAIKPHTEFADARSLRPAYEALRVRAEAAEKTLAERDTRIAELTKQLEEVKPVKEEVEQLRTRVSNVNFRETEPYKQTIAPLRTEAESILARASELALTGGKNDPAVITDTIRRMVSLPDRGQRRQLASEVFDDADVGEAVALAGALADVDRRYRATDTEWSQKASENLKLHRTREITTLREEAEIVRKEQDARLGFVATDAALAEHRQEGEKLANALLQLDDLPPRERRTILREAYWRVARFPAMWEASYQALEQLRIATAALKRKGIIIPPGGGGGAPVVAPRNNGGKDASDLSDEALAGYMQNTG